jgi:membrane-associated phospholipid phosphatase
MPAPRTPASRGWAAATVMAAAVLLTACGEDDDGEIVGGAAAPDEAVTEDLKVTTLQLAFPEDGLHEEGADVPLYAALTNTGTTAYQLVDVVGPDFTDARLEALDGDDGTIEVPGNDNAYLEPRGAPVGGSGGPGHVAPLVAVDRGDVRLRGQRRGPRRRDDGGSGRRQSTRPGRLPGPRRPDQRLMRRTPLLSDHTDTPERTAGVGRFEAQALLGWIAVVVGAVPFLLLWLLVQRSWAPLSALDGDVAAELNAWVTDAPLAVTVLRAVTDLAGTVAAVLIFTLTTLFLLVRRQRRLAAFAATTGLGLPLLGPLTKAMVDRARPVVDSPVVDTPSNASFPSGHALTGLVTFGVLLLLVLPGVRRRVRPWLIAGTVLLVLAIGFSRLALGVHFVSDVLAGWALGAAWLAATVAAFRVWQHRDGVNTDEPLDPLDVPPDQAAHLAPAADPVVPGGRATVARLLAWAAALFVVLSAMGLLVTRALADTGLARFDLDVVAWFAQRRSDDLTTVMKTIGGLSGTTAVIVVSLSLAVLALAVTASWRPVVFVTVAVLGEVLLYFVIGQVVSRSRPDVMDLTSGLPVGASWPSGHAAAAAALYGAVAAVVLTYSSARWRRAVLALPLLLPPAIGVTRIYVAAHHPTDVVAGLVLGGVWVLICARLLLRPTGERSRTEVRLTRPPVTSGRALR